MNEFKLLCPCLLGAEGMVADELRRMGAQGVTPENGRVFFDGGPQMTARANLRLRYGERVQIVLGVFEARTFEELFQNVRRCRGKRSSGKTTVSRSRDGAWALSSTACRTASPLLRRRSWNGSKAATACRGSKRRARFAKSSF